MRSRNRFLRDPGRSLARRSGNVRLAAVVEAMERRFLLSNSPIVVNTAADQVDPAGSHVVSLRDAVNLANSRAGADTITFDPTVFPANSFTVITLRKGPLAFTGSTGQTSVDGLGRVAINGHGATTDVVVNSGASLSLQYISIIGGYTGGNGGDINSAGTLALAHCNVSAGLAAAGGGIYSTGTLNLSDCTVQHNQAGTGGGIEVAGGSATIAGGTFTDNSASTAGGAIDVTAGTLNLTGDAFTGNQVTNGGYGGAVALGTTGTDFNSVTAATCTFTDNSVTNPDFPAEADGGAIGSYQHGSLTLSQSTFSHNSAGRYGGAIWSEGPLFRSTGDTFVGNFSAEGGEAVWTASALNMTDATFSNNYGNGDGGAILSEGNLTLSNSTFTENSCGTFGGALELTNTAYIIGCTFVGNLSPNSIGADGGAIDNQSGLTIINSTFTGNTANQGGAIGNRGRLTLDDSTVTGNLATPNGNGTTGGGLWTGPTASTTVNNSIVAGNSYVQSPNVDAPGDIAGSVTGGANLIGTGGSGGLTNGVNGNIVGVTDPRLGPLASNGGPTQTIALLAGSPAAGAGNVKLLPPGLTTDQRGLPRVTNGSLDIGAYQNQLGTLTGTVFNDTNGNGLRDPGEAGVSGVRVFLDYAGTGVWNSATEPSTLTNSTGVFTFKNIAAVTYGIGIVLPANTVKTTPAGDLVATVAAGKTVNAGLFGEIPIASGTGTVAGVVYNDHNVNGVQDSGDAGLANVKVFLDLKHTGAFATGDPSTLTGPSGAYVFANLKPGTYQIGQVVPAGYRQGYPFGGVENAATVTAGALSARLNFGDTTTSRVSGFVFVNLNSHGTGAGETGVNGVTVVVKPTKGAVSYTVQTNSAGYYVAGALPNGVAYTVTLQPPSGYTLLSGSLTRTTAVLGSGQTADNIDFFGKLAVPVVFLSQQRTLSASWGLDSEYNSGNGTSFVNTGPQGTVATGFGPFNSYTESGYNSGPITVIGDPSVTEINLDAKASQNSSLTTAQISDSGAVYASEGMGGDTAGSSYAQAESYFQTAFQVYAPEKFSVAAILSPTMSAFGSQATLSLTGPGGTPAFPTQGVEGGFSPTDNFNQSGTLGVGTYTLTLDAAAYDQAGFSPGATYSLNLKFG